ncbi:replication factor C subunit 1-like [Cimex lectularius]|uniref:AAA+ ATPase domain-containing protein n=1 Tax=Cimex lectularius TaxID=79782 RepID=A0A8I6RNT3_CIMLE|nr:replication factor C subunit 1-like [Cimex lectularius]
MKDLKHYFSSPKCSEDKGESIEEESTKRNADPAKKKRKKKRKRGNTECSEEDPVEAEVAKVKRKKELTPKVSLKQRNSDSSKENSLTEEEPQSPNKTLLSYFNKVDKIPPMEPKSNKVIVKAMVHHPPPDNAGKSVMKTKLRLRKQPGKPEYDVISSEEDAMILSSRLPQIKEAIDDIEIIYSTEVAENKDDVIIVSETQPLNNGKKMKIKSDGTLQSFFKRNRSQPLKELSEMNTERKSAIREFLHSTVATRLKPKEVIQGHPTPFPKISHVTQKDMMNIMWSLRTVKLDFVNRVKTKIEIPVWSRITDRSHWSWDEPQVKSIVQKKALKALKKEHKNLPITTWYRELSRQKKNAEGEMWTEKYKLERSDLVLGNKKNVERLKSWLQSFKEIGKSKEKESVDSGDEFLSDDDNKPNSIKNIAIISGPCGTGKTTAVYVLAKEIGYEVLELNASCNRNGKKIFKDFSEALQSHNANVITFAPVKKKKISTEKKRSLILIEDADLIFNNTDDGYLTTVISLAISSKRPVIFITNEYDSKHLAKLKPHVGMMLKFNFIKGEVLAAWLKTVSIAEGVSLEQDDVAKLTNNNPDIRQCLLQIQFSADSPKVDYSDKIKLNNTWNVIGKCNITCKNLIQETKRLVNILCKSDCLSQPVLEEAGDMLIPSFSYRELKNSTSLIHDGESKNILSEEIANYTLDMMHSIAGADDPYKSTRTTVVEVMNTASDNLLTPASQLSKGAICTDYMSALRAIARSEKRRLSSQTKRSNRFNNYINFLGLERNNEEVLETMCAGLKSDQT